MDFPWRHLVALAVRIGDHCLPMIAQEALLRLVDGNRRHAAGAPIHPRCDGATRAALTGGQRPWAAVLGCSDSRVPPELVFDQGLGDLFVVRTAGQVCDATVTASLGYALHHLHVPLVVVLGHTGCGAVTAALSRGLGEPEDCLCAAIRPAIERARLEGGDLGAQTLRLHVQGVAEHLRQDLPRLGRGEAVVVGGVYHLGSGHVQFVDWGALTPCAAPPR